MTSKKRLAKPIALLLTLVMITALLPLAPPTVQADEPTATSGIEKTYKLWYNSPAPQSNTHGSVVGNLVGSWNDDGWQNWSMPLGNGYFGANVWGRADTERIVFAETSIQNPNGAGLSTLMNLFLDFNHTNTSNYYRDLVLNDAIANVSYTSGGVTYTREYLTSYPDNIMAIKLTASQPGALTFNVRPIVPFVRPNGGGPNGYDHTLNQVHGKTAAVTADEETQTITLAGMMEAFRVRYEAQVRVINTGGTVTKDTWNFNPGTANDRSQTVNLGSAYNAESLRVAGADEVIILIAAGTNYPLDAVNFYTDPAVFTRANAQKLDQYPAPSAKVSKTMNDATAKGFDDIKADHLADYRSFFDRATIDLGGNANDARTTNQLLDSHRAGAFEPYLEELFFQFGRYLLICSSREGGFPAHLQGIWNAYEIAPWSGGFWHNINLQMNYWPAFNTNLVDLFKSYADYNEAFRIAARGNADSYLAANPAVRPEFPSGAAAVDPNNNRAPAGQGLNGWAIGTGTWPYRAEGPGSTSHSGPGTGGMTTSLFWEYYDFSRDPEILKNVTYPAVSEMANFLSKTLIKEGDAFLVKESASPEIDVRNPNHPLPTNATVYYRTTGALFDQQMVYDVYRTTLEGMEALKDNYTDAELQGLLGFDDGLFDRAFANYDINGVRYGSFEELLEAQLPNLEPVIIGASGQVKEYREEVFYGDIGDPTHRHISHLIGLYPGTVINSTTPHWFDGARRTLNGRGDGGTGWAIGHKLNFWARMADGNRSYTLLRNLLTVNNGVYYNLWGRHAPFQIDANFGGTSGMAEMLINSHEGFISLLPSRPDQWSSGSFQGLTARGNFEVDAVWQNHQAVEFAVTSNSGVECTLRYFNIAGATVTDSKGNAVAFTSNGSDFITFPTQKGETYTVTEIPQHTETEPVTNLEMSINSAGVNLSWNPVAGAASYNVYVAEGSQPDYTLLANVGEDTDFVIARDGTFAGGFKFDPDARQFTFRVTAVAASGRESEGVIRILIPPLTPTRATGIFFDSDGTTVLEVNTASDSRTEGNSYKLYEATSGQADYVEKASSSYPVLYFAGADEGKDYYVSAFNVFTGESGKLKVTISDDRQPIANVFLRKPITPNEYTARADTIGMGIERLVDGQRTNATRFALNDGQAAGGVQFEIDMLNEYMLAELRIYEWSDSNNRASRSQYTIMEAYLDGTWTDVFRGLRLPNVNTNTGTTNPITIDLTQYGSVVASKVRFTFINNAAGNYPILSGSPGSAFTGNQIEATTAVPPLVNKSALLDVITRADSIDQQRGFGVNWPADKLAEYTTAKSNALSTLSSEVAGQSRVDADAQALEGILAQAEGLSRAALTDLIGKAEAYIAGKSGQERQVAEALINESLNAAKAISAANPAAALVDIHLSAHRLNSALAKAEDEILARMDLIALIAQAAGFLEAIDETSPLHVPALAQEITAARNNAQTISAADDPMESLAAIQFAHNRLQNALDAYAAAINAQLTLSLSGGIFTAAQVLTLSCTNERIVDFFYTIDGSDPTASSRRVQDMSVTLPHGFYDLKAAGFINGQRVTGIEQAQFFMATTANVARSSTASTNGTIVPGMGADLTNDGNIGSRLALQGGSNVYLQYAMGSAATVDAIIIHCFVEPSETTRLGTSFSIQYQDAQGAWVTAYRGNGNDAVPTNLDAPGSGAAGIRQRAGDQRQVYAIKLPAPIQASAFRISGLSSNLSIWEVELYEAAPAVKWTVTFDADNGTAAWVAEVTEGGPVDEPAVPVKAGYRFEGWLLGGAPYDFEAAVYEDITLVGSWFKLLELTVTYNANGGTGGSAVPVLEGASHTVLGGTGFSRANHSFAGWNTAANGTGTRYSPGASLEIEQDDITLYAQWTRTAVGIGPGPIILPSW